MCMSHVISLFMSRNTNSIYISKSIVQHSRTKYIDIWHHFIKDLIKSNTFLLQHIHIDLQLVNLFTKLLDYFMFESLRKAIGVCASPWDLVCVSFSLYGYLKWWVSYVLFEFYYCLCLFSALLMSLCSVCCWLYFFVIYDIVFSFNNPLLVS